MVEIETSLGLVVVKQNWRKNPSFTLLCVDCSFLPKLHICLSTTNVGRDPSIFCFCWVRGCLWAECVLHGVKWTSWTIGDLLALHPCLMWLGFAPAAKRGRMSFQYRVELWCGLLMWIVFSLIKALVHLNAASRFLRCVAFCSISVVLVVEVSYWLFPRIYHVMLLWLNWPLNWYLSWSSWRDQPSVW